MMSRQPGNVAPDVPTMASRSAGSRVANHGTSHISDAIPSTMNTARQPWLANTSPPISVPATGPMNMLAEIAPLANPRWSTRACSDTNRALAG